MPTKTQIAGGHKANMTTLIPLKSAKQHSHEVALQVLRSYLMIILTWTGSRLGRLQLCWQG